MKDVILTPEGFKQLKGELDYLRTQRRREVAERIAAAREFGEIAENAEYDDAKNEQMMLEHRIAQLEERLVNARLIDTTLVSTRRLSMTWAFARRSSSCAMRCSSIICSFFASSYSAFSAISPNSRAAAMRSAISRRFWVRSTFSSAVSCL